MRTPRERGRVEARMQNLGNRSGLQTVGGGLILVAVTVLVGGCLTLGRREPGAKEVAEEHYLKALAHLQKQDLDMALVEMRLATDRDPTMAIYHHVYGNLLLQKGEPVQAELEYRQAIALAPSHDPSWEGLIQAVARQGKREAVAQVITRRIQMDPLDAEWRLRLGKTYEEAGNLVGAEREFREAANLAKGDRAAYAYARLGLVYEAMGRRADAIREYEESLKTNPKQPDLRQVVDSLKAAPTTRPAP